MFIEEDIKDFRINWVKVLCKKGQVHISVLKLSHRADGPSKSTRQIMLLWFINIQDDLQALKVIKGGI
jgi:hypothetical protein